VAIWTLSAISAEAADAELRANWPRFRGPLGTGVTTEKDLPLRWGNEENITWKLTIPGEGSSSPVVWNDRIFLTTGREKNGVRGYDRWLVCVDRRSGQVAWETLVASGDPGETHADNPHASSTPAVDGERVYTFFGKGGLQCHDFDGQLLWRRDDLGEFLSIWGTAGSPILEGDLCIVCCDQDAALVFDPDPSLPSRAYILAVNKLTGQDVWRTTRFGCRGFGTPVPFVRPDGKRELILNGPDGVHAYDPLKGTLNWSVHRATAFGEPHPAFGHGLIYVYSGRPGLAFAIKPGGSGDITKTHVAWSVNRRNRDVSSPVVRGNELICFDRGGAGGAYDALTGKDLWKARVAGSIYASPVVSGDGNIYFLTRNGVTHVLPPTPGGLNPIAENRLGTSEEDFSASPAVSNGQIFIRSDSVLYCIGEER
jgi:outer membrane protein assembly factor BamB